MSVQIARRYFNTEDFYRMLEAGILTEDDRVELIDGEVLEMSPIGSRHAGCVMRLTALFAERFGRSAIVNVQNPVRLNELSEPQPDIALLKPREDFYAQSHPVPADVLLIVEVADSSVEYDRRLKVPLYARAGISEVWVINLNKDIVETYTQPEHGSYSDVREFGRGQAIASPQISSPALSVDALLG